jgi:hypothetical protein
MQVSSSSSSSLAQWPVIVSRQRLKGLPKGGRHFGSEFGTGILSEIFQKHGFSHSDL